MILWQKRTPETTEIYILFHRAVLCVHFSSFGASAKDKPKAALSGSNLCDMDCEIFERRKGE